MRLVELMFSQASQPLLGLPEGKNPPEKSMYLSVLQQAQVHREVRGTWTLGNPPESDPCNVRPALDRIRALIQDQPDTRIPLDQIFRELRRAPYGLRDGLIPLLLAVIAIADEQEVAFYKNGTFLTELHQEAFLQLTKNPQDFEIQYCKIQGIRSEVFARLSHILELKPEGQARVELLDITRKLCVFAASLPEYTRTTKRLTRAALAVREALLTAQEPVKLVFHDLPTACGFPEFHAQQSNTTSKAAQQFVGTLKTALDELKTAFDRLQARQRTSIAKEFGCEGQDFSQARWLIASRAEALLLHVTEPRLKAFCFRLMDESLPEGEWLESVGSLLALRPPQRWKDEEEDTFDRELAALVGRFLRSESVVFRTAKGDKSRRGLRIAVTQADGQEKQEVIHFTPEEEKQLGDLEQDLLKLIGRNKRLGLAAASRAIWTQLKGD
jgi:hypothetical protein